MRRAVLLALTLTLVTQAARAAPVRVLYAGSLVNLMERGLGPAFERSSGQTFEGFAGGSMALVNQIRDHLRPADAFISANPSLNDKLGDRVRWYVVFAQSPLVIGYNPSSRFANDFRTRPWFDVLREPGLRLGRTDPSLDPKGALTVKLLDRAERTEHIPGLARSILGAPGDASEILPEETLVGRLQSGQLDAGFFYSTETADLHIPFVAFPADIALSARYSVTVLTDAPDAGGADRFTAFLLGPDGRAIMRQHGLDLVAPTASGDVAAIPASIRAELHRPE